MEILVRLHILLAPPLVQTCNSYFLYSIEQEARPKLGFLFLQDRFTAVVIFFSFMGMLSGFRALLALFQPDVHQATAYYAFGQEQKGRIEVSAPDAYRYGYNGKEKDQSGEWGLTSYDYGFRIYNPAIAKFLSVDPLTDEYAHYSPYQFAGLNPIVAIDLDGAEEEPVHQKVGYKTVPVIPALTAVETAKKAVPEIIKKVGTKVAPAIIGGIVGTLMFVLEPANSLNDPSVKRHEEFAQKNIQKFELDYLEGKVNKGESLSNVEKARYSLLLGKIRGIHTSEIRTTSLRLTIADNFYRKSGYSDYNNHLDGIDFDKPVSIQILKQGTVVEQWVREGGKVGDYFTVPDTDPSSLGIKTTGRVKMLFELTEDVRVLKSTAGDIAGHKGGGTQYFSTELKNKAKTKD